MRIAYLAAGAAGMYCGSCLHDNTLAAALLKQGEEVLLVPTYTPLKTDEPSVSQRRVFMGGVNAYLQQASSFFRHTPKWFDRLLDNPTFLNWVTRGASSVDPAKLGGLTVSMLKGEKGNQRKSLEQLVDWLVDEVKPDVVHLSNSMLLGLARRIRERCGPPVVCALSGEDLFLEALVPPHYDEARRLLCERAAEVEAFTSLNNYYADFMADYLSVDRSKMHVVPHGLGLDGIIPRSDEDSGELAIGYLARICPEKGFHLFIEACEELAIKRPDLSFRVKTAGYLGAGDREYFLTLRRRIDRGPLKDRFEYLGEVTREQKYEMLRSLTAFATPTVYAESKGIPAIEAMAAGVPVVLPNHGSFPELVTDTEAGLLHQPEDPESLSEELEKLLDDPDQAAQLGRRGRMAIEDRYHADQMATSTRQVYEKLLQQAESSR